MLPLAFILIAVLTCVVVYALFATDEPSKTVAVVAATPKSEVEPVAHKQVEEEVAEEEIAEVQLPDPNYKSYGVWGEHIASFFLLDAIEFVGDGRYRVNTGELCPSLNSCIGPALDEGVAVAVIFADRINMRSSRSTSSSDNIIDKLEYGDQVRVVELCDDDWAKVEILNDKEEVVEGYVSSLYMCDTARFELMNSHVTPSKSSRSNISEAKWRRAVSEVLYNIGIMGVTPTITTDVAKICNMGGDERVVVFNLSREDNDLELLVAIEFFKGNEEFRLLAVIPGGSVVDVKSTGAHTYDMQYKF